MDQRVPVADNLLTTKLKGHSVKRLAQALAVPLAPGIVLTVLNFPIWMVGPVGLLGLALGGAIYYRTPSTQVPHRWVLGLIQLRIGNSRYHWKPVETEENPVEYQNYMVSKDEENTKTEEQADQHSGEESLKDRIFGSRNTVDHLDFDYIRDDGVIVTEDGYSKIVEIDPRPWLILDAEQRDSVLEKFGKILKGIKYPFQIHQLPVPYDNDDYFESLHEAAENRNADEHPLITHGRREHRNFLDGVVNMADIRERRHFITVHVEDGALNPNGDAGNSLLDILPTSFSDPSEEEEISTEQYVDEVDSRATSIAQAFPPTGVNPEVVDSGSEVRKILYFYYQNQKPGHELETSWLTQEPTHQDVDEDRANSPNLRGSVENL